jgi:hypothetical protein
MSSYRAALPPSPAAFTYFLPLPSRVCVCVRVCVRVCICERMLVCMNHAHVLQMVYTCDYAQCSKTVLAIPV